MGSTAVFEVPFLLDFQTGVSGEHLHNCQFWTKHSTALAFSQFKDVAKHCNHTMFSRPKCRRWSAIHFPLFHLSLQTCWFWWNIFQFALLLRSFSLLLLSFGVISLQDEFGQVNQYFFLMFLAWSYLGVSQCRPEINQSNDNFWCKDTGPQTIF